MASSSSYLWRNEVFQRYPGFVLWNWPALLALIFGGSSTVACPPRHGEFKVFAAMNYAGQPNFRSRGLLPAHVIDRDFWRGDPGAHDADPAKIAAVVAKLPIDGGPIVIDIEWPNLGRGRPGSARSIATLAQIGAWFKAAAGSRPVGYYGIFPFDDYWRAIDVPPGGVRDWQLDNNASAALGAHVDATFPSLYTYYDDRAGWVRQAHALVCEARRISSKPVYVFLWPEFLEPGRAAERDIPADYWRLELETLYGIADGVVIWGGYDTAANHQRRWDEDAPWWMVTRELMAKWRKAKAPAPAAVQPNQDRDRSTVRSGTSL